MNYRFNLLFLPKRRIKCLLLTSMTILTIIAEVNTKSDNECPEMEHILYAYPEGDVFEFDHTYDPLLKTNIDLIDRFLAKDNAVECAWEVRAKEDHYASISFEEFQLVPQTPPKHGDVLRIYDGQHRYAPLIAELDADASLEEFYRSSENRYLYVVFSQGEGTGRRYFQMRYEAVPRPKDLIIKIAVIASSCVAAVGVLFLAFKFSRNCRPCRKRCCPNVEEEVRNEVHSQRELRPLTPQPEAPPSAPTATEDNLRNEAVVVGFAGLAGYSMGRNMGGATAWQEGQPQPFNNAGEEYDHDDQLSPLPDMPPPSYDDVFGQMDDGEKRS